MEFVVGSYAIRNDNGRRVYVAELRPIGLRIFAVTEDVRDGHTTIIDVRDLRPTTKEIR